MQSHDGYYEINEAGKDPCSFCGSATVPTVHIGDSDTEYEPTICASCLRKICDDLEKHTDVL